MSSFKQTIGMVTSAGLCLAIFSAFAYGGTNMEQLYNINDAITLKPEIYDIGTDSLISLFPVPQDNSIGTNDLNNAITLLSFHKGKIKQEQYFKDAYDQVGGGGTFIPVIAQDTIGFGQVRRFMLYNFKTKVHKRFRIVVPLDETIQKIAIADARLRRFIFEIKEYNRKTEDHRDYTSHLILMELSGKEARLIKEISREDGVTWSVVSDKIFLYDYDKPQLRVLNMHFEPANHPLADVINQNKGKIRFMWIHPHPYLPFAILSGGRYGSVLINWGASRETKPLALFTRATQFSFSPDGNWLIFRKEMSSEKQNTYLMPVSDKYPHYLGSPILLLNNYFNSNNCGWTTNPISFVESDGEIYRWELTNAAHPESDKATFHDYIVEHDLEKLRKEKRQKLGENHK